MDQRNFVKTILILVGVIVILSGTLSYLLFSSSRKNNGELEKYLDNKIIELNKSNERIQASIDSLRKENLIEQQKLFKLAEQKQKLKIIYVDKIKAIDNYSDSDIVNEFDVFFSKKNSHK